MVADKYMNKESSAFYSSYVRFCDVEIACESCGYWYRVHWLIFTFLSKVENSLITSMLTTAQSDQHYLGSNKW